MFLFFVNKVPQKSTFIHFMYEYMWPSSKLSSYHEIDRKITDCMADLNLYGVVQFKYSSW